MLILLSLSASLAATVSIPMKAAYVEYTDGGTAPEVVSSVRSAKVATTNAETGASYPTTGELLLKERSAGGRGELNFSAEPSGSLRTWAFYLLDANGEPLTAEPQILDILFGNDGDGTVVAQVGANIVIKAVKIKKKNPRVASDDGGYDIALSVEDTGLGVAYVGIQELASNGAPITAHVDMESMTADVYASFQGLALDGIVPLDTWRAELAGNLLVSDLSVSGKTVEGGASFDYALTFGGSACKADCVELGSATYGGDALRATGKKINHPFENIVISHKVQLVPSQVEFDVYDGGMAIVIEGDGRGLEVSAFLNPVGEAPAAITSELLTLSPSDIAVGGAATTTGKFPAKPEVQAVRTVGLQPLGEGGTPLASWLDCTLTPTRLSAVAGSTALGWVGECLRDSDGEVAVRGLHMTMDSTGATQLYAELLGTEWQKATTLAFDVDGDDLELGYAEASAAVTSTVFSLAWSFASDPDGAAYTGTVYFDGATEAVDFSFGRDGWYVWNELATGEGSLGTEGYSYKLGGIGATMARCGARRGAGCGGTALSDKDGSIMDDLMGM